MVLPSRDFICKANNGSTKIFEQISHSFGVSTVDFEQVNTGWLYYWEEISHWPFTSKYLYSILLEKEQDQTFFHGTVQCLWSTLIGPEAYYWNLVKWSKNFLVLPFFYNTRIIENFHNTGVEHIFVIRNLL